MATASLTDRDPRVEALRRQFLERVMADCDAIAGLVNPVNDAGILALRSLCHFLKGSAPIFGYADLCDAAQALHHEIRQGSDDRASIMAKWAALFELTQRCRARSAQMNA
jgi:hypothetical protein